METFTIETPVCVDDVTLIPIACNRLYSYYSAMRYWLTANKEPQAIIICDLNGTHAFDMSSNEISISSLSKKIPNLNALLISQGYDCSSD